MVLITGGFNPEELLYDVNDPLHPRLLCTIRNTSARLFTGDTFEYLKPVSANQTDVMLHSLGSGNESHAGSFPFYVTSGSWLGDSTVMTYSVRPDTSQQTMEVWLYAQRTNAVLYTYQIGIGRIGMPPPVDSPSPDGQFIVAGWIAGKGSEPLAVYRVSDRTRVMSFDQTVDNAVHEDESRVVAPLEEAVDAALKHRRQDAAHERTRGGQAHAFREHEQQNAAAAEPDQTQDADRRAPLVDEHQHQREQEDAACDDGDDGDREMEALQHEERSGALIVSGGRSHDHAR